LTHHTGWGRWLCDSKNKGENLENIKELIATLDNQFCVEQLKEFMENPGIYQAEATNLIDDVSAPLKGFLYGLSLAMGIDGVIGANVLLSMLIRFEARQESLKDTNKR
jgi:hypothetical protein